jgi:hypothetical protein
MPFWTNFVAGACGKYGKTNCGTASDYTCCKSCKPPFEGCCWPDPDPKYVDPTKAFSDYSDKYCFKKEAIAQAKAEDDERERFNMSR